MSLIRHVQRDAYHVLDWRDCSDVSINKFWKQFPELVVGKYLVNTSFDSGFLALSDADRTEGWRIVGRLAHSPRICSTEQIPHDQYDEWLIFEQPVEVREFATMVNYLSFSPIDFDWEEKREHFWSQVL